MFKLFCVFFVLFIDFLLLWRGTSLPMDSKFNNFCLFLFAVVLFLVFPLVAFWAINY